MSLLFVVSFITLVTFNYAEYPWVTSNMKAREAAQKKDFNKAVNQYKKSNEILRNLSKYEDVELLLSEVRMMRFDCLSGKQISVKKLSNFCSRLDNYYEPLMIKLFDDLYNLCRELHNSKQYQSCWWLLQRIQKIYLNRHDTEQLKSLVIMRTSLQDLAMLAVFMLESDMGSKTLADPQRVRYLIEENLSEAESLGCGLATLRLANTSYQESEFLLSASQARISLIRLTRDIEYLLGYAEKNQNQISSSNNLFIYLRSMIFGIQELRDFLEILKDKVDLKKYFEEISKQGLEQYLSGLDDISSIAIRRLKKFVPDGFIRSYELLDEKSISSCNSTMQIILKGIRLHHIDTGVWLDFDAKNNFEKAYGYLKKLASNQYINPLSRNAMRRCFSKLKFRHPNLSTDYNSLTLSE